MKSLFPISTQAAVAFLGLGGYLALGGLAYVHPAVLNNPVGGGVLATFASFATIVFGYYFGSSAGSAAKTQHMIAQANGEPTPVAPVEAPVAAPVVPPAAYTMPPLKGP